MKGKILWCQVLRLCFEPFGGVLSSKYEALAQGYACWEVQTFGMANVKITTLRSTMSNSKISEDSAGFAYPSRHGFLPSTTSEIRVGSSTSSTSDGMQSINGHFRNLNWRPTI